MAVWTLQFGGVCGSEKDVTVEEGCRHAAHNLDQFFTITPLVSLLSVLLTRSGPRLALMIDIMVASRRQEQSQYNHHT